MRRSNLSRRHFKPILKKAGLDPETRPYDLRRTFATHWMESGEDRKLLQRVLGHSRYETTATATSTLQTGQQGRPWDASPIPLGGQYSTLVLVK